MDARPSDRLRDQSRFQALKGINSVALVKGQMLVQILKPDWLSEEVATTRGSAEDARSTNAGIRMLKRQVEFLSFIPGCTLTPPLRHPPDLRE